MTLAPMKTYLLPLLLLALLPLSALATETSPKAPPAECVACREFNNLNTLVRDGRIIRRQAREELAALIPRIREYYYAAGGKDFTEAEWVFPLKGYDVKAIGGGRRHGFEPRGYDYFSGNRHGGHPALDIFIRDSRQDMRDRKSGDYVPVLSMTGGIVVATENKWQPGSQLRGGRYLWIYDPAGDALVYYAHNRELNVAVGDRVSPGQVIAQVGRSGLNAYKRRSPTHLHLTVLRYANGALRPEYIYRQLKNSRPVP